VRISKPRIETLTNQRKKKSKKKTFHHSWERRAAEKGETEKSIKVYESRVEACEAARAPM
jgi:hypothetical protein